MAIGKHQDRERLLPGQLYHWHWQNNIVIPSVDNLNMFGLNARAGLWVVRHSQSRCEQKAPENVPPRTGLGADPATHAGACKNNLVWTRATGRNRIVHLGKTNFRVFATAVINGVDLYLFKRLSYRFQGLNFCAARTALKTVRQKNVDDVFLHSGLTPAGFIKYIERMAALFRVVNVHCEHHLIHRCAR